MLCCCGASFLPPPPPPFMCLLVRTLYDCWNLEYIEHIPMWRLGSFLLVTPVYFISAVWDKQTSPKNVGLLYFLFFSLSVSELSSVKTLSNKVWHDLFLVHCLTTRPPARQSVYLWCCILLVWHVCSVLCRYSWKMHFTWSSVNTYKYM